MAIVALAMAVALKHYSTIRWVWQFYRGVNAAAMAPAMATGSSCAT
jgi:hypothetical protein